MTVAAEKAELTKATEKVVLTKEGFKVGSTQYLRAEVASPLIGLHPQSLARVFRESGRSDEDRIGTKLGRTLFFTLEDLSRLGYEIDFSKLT